MPDYFATLGLPRAPWVDAELLKERFYRMGASVHPDAGGSSEAFAQVNASWLTLRDPAECLRHFLELEHPAALAGASQTPLELGDVFMEIAAARQHAQGVAGRLSAATSPLGRSLLEPERVAARARLAGLASRLSARLHAAHAAVQSAGLDSAALVKLLSTMVFLTKWSRQLAESAMVLEAGSAA